MPSPKQSPVRGLHSPSAPATKRGASIRLRTLLILVSAVVFLGSASVYVAPRVAAGLMASWRPFAMGQAPAAAPTDGAWRTAAPFIFVSVQGFLKQWPNSYAPNGHSIVAGTLVPGTVLYHAKQSPGPPSKPTFFAFDAEMSVGIYGGSGRSKLHVYSTTRSMDIIYFDGQSATLTPGGSLDSQMAVIQGEVPVYPQYDLVYDEDQRALDLCELVAELGIDGVVRMSAGFEVLICDREAVQMRELFLTNITVPGNRVKNPDGLPRDPNRQSPRGFGNIFSEQGSYEWLRSASWHYGHRGSGEPSERQVRLDLCRMISFYDPDLNSLIDSHHGGIVGIQTFENGWGLRRGHRLLDIDKADVDRVRSWLRAMTLPASKSASCSGVDWDALVSTVQAQHGTRARDMGAAFEWPSGTEADAKAIITKVHELTYAILAPCLEYAISSDPDGSTTPKNQTIARCASVYTLSLDPKSLSRSELLLYHSINIVTEKLCTWEWELFEWSEKRTTNYWATGMMSLLT